MLKKKLKQLIKNDQIFF